MSHAFHESRTVPDDHLLVRPYVARSGRPAGPAGPAWPQTGPVTFPGPAPRIRTDPGRGPAPDPTAAPAPAAGTGTRAASGTGTASGSGTASGYGSGRSPGSGRERGGRRPAALVALLALLALAAAGGLVLLLGGPDPEPARAVPPPGLSVPVLPLRSPGAAAEDPATGAVPEAAPSTRATQAPTGAASPGPSGSRDPKPPPSASAAVPPADDGTLRPGDRGGEVRALQERLHGQGFTYVTVNGVYDDRTRRGVAQLQSDRSIKGDPTGVYGPATRAAFD